MKKAVKILLVAAGLAVASTAAIADGHLAKAVKARQAAMQLYAFNIGILGAMAQGKMDYDANAASAAANNLKALSVMDGSAMWPPGSGNDNKDLKTAALPTIWSTWPAVAEKGKAFATAASAMADNAGNGLDALRANIGALGKSCGGCHQDFRQKN